MSRLPVCQARHLKIWSLYLEKAEPVVSRFSEGFRGVGTAVTDSCEPLFEDEESNPARLIILKATSSVFLPKQRHGPCPESENKELVKI